MGEVTLRNGCRGLKIDPAWLRRVVAGTVSDAAVRRGASHVEYEVGVLLVGAKAMARLNERHLGHAGATDVITFDYGPPPGAQDNVRWLRGEIVVCPEMAREAARQWRTHWREEVGRYVVHGLLHLCGYDDQEPEARRAMKREENRLVAGLVRKRASRRPVAG
jgi:probable rRNA maturation factor